MKYICPYRNNSLEQAAQVAVEHFTLKDGLLSSRAAGLDPALANRLLLHAVNAEDGLPVITEQEYASALQILDSLPFRDTAGWIERLPALFCLEHTLLARVAAQLFYEVLDNDSLLAHIRLEQMPGCELLVCFNPDHDQNACPGMEAAVVDLTGSQPLLRLSISAPDPGPGTVLLTARLVVDELIQSAAAPACPAAASPDPDPASPAAPGPVPDPANPAVPGPGPDQPADSFQTFPDESAGQAVETMNWW